MSSAVKLNYSIQTSIVAKLHKLRRRGIAGPRESRGVFSIPINTGGLGLGITQMMETNHALRAHWGNGCGNQLRTRND